MEGTLLVDKYQENTIISHWSLKTSYKYLAQIKFKTR